MRSFAFAALAVLAACPSSGSNSFLDAGGSSTADAAIDAPLGDAGSGDIITGSGCTHQFHLAGYGSASAVWVSGDFVDWAATPGSGAVPMALDGSSSTWAATYMFGSGTYQYKFIINGSMWIADPADSDVVDDGFGGVNSIYVCI